MIKSIINRILIVRYLKRKVKKLPVIIFEGPGMTKEQKEQLVKEFTLTASRITNLSPEKFTTLIREYDPENVGTGTDLLVNIKKQ